LHEKYYHLQVLLKQGRMKISSSRVELQAAKCIKAEQATGCFVDSLRRECGDGEAGDDQVLCGLPVHLPFAGVDDGPGVSLDCQPCAAKVDSVAAQARCFDTQIQA
jgi:hypothetical protein